MRSLKFSGPLSSWILATSIFFLKVPLPASVTECSPNSITNVVFMPEVECRPALDSDKPGVVSFFGSDAAALFAREIGESFRGVLSQDYFSKPEGKYPLGFLQASPFPQPWSGTMWSRDSGAFLRELIHWGYFAHACEVANCLINFSGTNAEGFVAFPEYFRPGDVNKTGSEIDGQAAIIIAMVNLWQELPYTNAFRARLYDFLNRSSSPVRYFHHVLETEPLIPGKNEFGGGCGVPGYYDNVVQNNLAALALIVSADMEEKVGDKTTAKVWRHDAIKIRIDMERYLVDTDGSWLWCIDPKTLKPDWAILNENINEGFGGLNGVACMYSDVLGFEPLASNWPGIQHCQRTFDKLYSYPARRRQFDKYGFWSQFDIYRGGLSSGPSYGEGYALQTMLLFDKLDMAGKSLCWLANTTYKAEGINFKGERRSPYYFYERTYSPEACGKMEFDVGCGALNLISVTEPLKVARLIVGVDDTSSTELKILPRVPRSWSGYETSNWPMFTGGTVVRANLCFKQNDQQAIFHLKLAQGERIPSLAVRMPSKSGWVWERAKNVSDIEFRSQMQ